MIEVYHLKKNSWHAFLMKFLWGYTYRDFSSFCPYFWLSLVNVLIIGPAFIFFLFKLIAFWIADNVYEPILNAIERQQKKQRAACLEKETIWRKQTLEMLVKETEIFNETGVFGPALTKVYKAKKGKYRKFYDSLYYTDSYFYDRLSSAIRRVAIEAEEKRRKIEEAQHELNKEKEEAARLVMIRRKKAIAKMTNIITFTMQLVGYLLAVVTAWYMMYVVSWMTRWPWVSIGSWIVGFIIAAVLFCFACGIVWLVWICIKYVACLVGPYCIPCDARREAIGRLFGKIGTGVVYSAVVIGYPFYLIFKFCKFIWELIVIFKQDNCPAIRWEE